MPPPRRSSWKRKHDFYATPFASYNTILLWWRTDDLFWPLCSQSRDTEEDSIYTSRPCSSLPLAFATSISIHSNNKWIITTTRKFNEVNSLKKRPWYNNFPSPRRPIKASSDIFSVHNSLMIGRVKGSMGRCWGNGCASVSHQDVHSSPFPRFLIPKFANIKMQVNNNPLETTTRKINDNCI